MGDENGNNLDKKSGNGKSAVRLAELDFEVLMYGLVPATLRCIHAILGMVN